MSRAVLSCIGAVLFPALQVRAGAGVENLSAAAVLRRIDAEHPRLAFRKAGLRELRIRCSTFQKPIYGAIKSAVTSNLSRDGDARNCAQTAFVYQVTGDAKYGEAAKRKILIELPRYCAYIRGRMPLVVTRPPYDRRRNVHYALDWVWDRLSDEERRGVGDQLIPLADEWLRRQPGWLKHAYFGGYDGFSNALITGTLLVGSGVNEKRAAELFEIGFEQMKGVQMAFAQVGRDDGGMIPGFHYACAGYYRMTLEFMITMKGAADIDLFDSDGSRKHAGVWMAYGVHMPWALPLLEDTWPGLSGLEGWMALAAGIYKDPVAQWIAKETGALRPNAGEDALLQVMLGDLRVPAIPPDARYPLARHFEGLGQVSMRAAWRDGATHAIFHCGDSIGNHAHDDVGQFLIYRKGRLVTDVYGKVPQSEAHNILLLEKDDSGAQRSSRNVPTPHDGTLLPYPFKAPNDFGDIVAFETNRRYTYVAADIARAYPRGRAREYIRHFLWLVPDTFVIFDCLLTTANPVWQAHCRDEPKIGESSAVITASEGGKLFIVVALPQKVKISKDRQSLPAVQGEGGDSNWRITVRPESPQTSFLVVLHAADKSVQAGPGVAMATEGNRVGVVLSVGGRRYEVLFNARGGVGGTVKIGGKEQKLTTRVQPQSGYGLGGPETESRLAGSEEGVEGGEEEGDEPEKRAAPAPPPPPKVDPARVAEALRALLARAVESFNQEGRRPERVFADIFGKTERVKLVGLTPEGYVVDFRGTELPLKWSATPPSRAYGILRHCLDPDGASDHLLLARFCAAAGLDEEANREVREVMRLDPDLAEEVRALLATPPREP